MKGVEFYSIIPPVWPIPSHSKFSYSSDTYVTCTIFGIHVCIMRELFLVLFDYHIFINKAVMVAFERLLGWLSHIVDVTPNCADTWSNIVSAWKSKMTQIDIVTLHRRWYTIISCVNSKLTIAFRSPDLISHLPFVTRNTSRPHSRRPGIRSLWAFLTLKTTYSATEGYLLSVMSGVAGHWK